MDAAQWVWIGLLTGATVCLPIGFLLGFAQGYACRDKQLEALPVEPREWRTGGAL